MASDIENLEFFSGLNPKRLTSLNEDAKNERAQILADQKRFAKYGTNSAKRAAMIEGGKTEEVTYERFPEEEA
jgi:hypothetical protein